MKSKLPTFTSHTQRTRGGVGFYSDARSNSRLEEMGCAVSMDVELMPGELRKYNKRSGQGQKFDFFEVKGSCAKCKKINALNIVCLCGSCAREEALHGVSQAKQELAIAELTALMLALVD